MSNTIMSSFVKLDFKLTIFYRKLIIYLTWLYSVHFLGAFPPGINDFMSWAIILSPIFVAKYLIFVFQEKTITISFSFTKMLFLAIGIFTFCFFNLKNPNLFSDEMYYSQRSFVLANIFRSSLSNTFVSLRSFRTDIILQITTILLYIIPFYFIFCLRYTRNYINPYLLIIAICRIFICWKFNGIGEPHPPMQYMMSSLLTSIFGISELNFRVAQTIPFFLIVLYFFQKYNLSIFGLFILILLISIDPIIGYWNVYVEQANYFVLFGVLISILFLRNETDIKVLSLVVGISMLYRAPAISFCVFPIIASVRESKKVTLKTLINLSPLLIGLPVFARALIYGTPSSNTLGDLPAGIGLFKSLFNHELIWNSFNCIPYVVCILIIVYCFLIIKKKWFFVLALLGYQICYLTLHNLSHSPKFESKYYYEFFGVPLVLFYIFLAYILDSYSVTYSKLKLSLILFLFTLNSIIFKMYASNKNAKYFEKDYNFNPVQNLNNNRKEIINLFSDVLDHTIIIDIDYGNFPFVLNKMSELEIKKVCLVAKKYKNIKKGWLNLDTKAISSLRREINFLIIMDGLSEINKNEINYLIQNGWEIHMSKGNDSNSIGWIVLKNKDFTNTNM